MSTDRLHMRPRNIAQLRAILGRYKIPVQLYGQGKAKTIAELLEEVTSGACTLFVQGHALIRKVDLIRAEIRCQVGGVLYELIEDRLEFTNGQPAQVRKDMITGGPCKGVAKKLMPGERLTNGLARVMKTALRLDSGYSAEPRDVVELEFPTNSYPGILTFYRLHNFLVILPPEHFRAEGYVEREKEKSTHFRWEAVTA